MPLRRSATRFRIPAMHATFAESLAQYGPARTAGSSLTLSESRDYCRRLARSHYENFTVASWLLPRRLLPHFYAIYAYCRWADDLADEVGSAEQSLNLLDWWDEQLHDCYRGEATHPVFVALGSTIREFEIPIEPLANLLVAFRQDQLVTRYASAADLLDYCRNSANPVGELVLYLGQCHSSESVRLSDAVCTGLQLANFCQDVANDLDRGRVYLPQAELQQAGYTTEMLAAREFNREFRTVMQRQVERADRLLREGCPLVDQVPRKLKVDIALFISGGLAILDEIRQIGYNVWYERPKVSRRQQLRLLARCWWRTRRGKRQGWQP